MVFSSLTFMLQFLPIIVGLYFVRSDIRWRNGVLLVGSLLFYAWGEPLWIFAMLASAFVNWVCAGFMGATKNRSARRAFLIIGICFSTALLFACKYSVFFANSFLTLIGSSKRFERFPLPIGISFYTFQIISYTIDVYRRKTRVQNSFPRLLLYVSCFPQLIAGPIVRYSDVAREIRSRKTTPDDFSAGMQRFVIGFGKKAIFANLLGQIMEELPAATAAASFGGAWYAAFVYALQIYFDFSGYSDMAIGLGRIFGFHFLENFNYPYIATTITDFWRRWHMSLSSWFRDYVYIPLGGSRVSVRRNIFNLAIVWTLTGLWHGAAWNYVLWGVYYGTLLVIEKFVLKNVLKKIPDLVRYPLTFLLVLVGWVIFRIEDVGAIGVQLGAMLGFTGRFMDAQSLTIIRTYSFFPVIAFFASMPILPLLKARLASFMENGAMEVVRCVALSAVLALGMLFLIGSSVNPFIYFQF